MQGNEDPFPIRCLQCEQYLSCVFFPPLFFLPNYILRNKTNRRSQFSTHSLESGFSLQSELDFRDVFENKEPIILLISKGKAVGKPGAK